MKRAFEIKGIDHIVLRVADIQRSDRFYTAVLGCTKERELNELGLHQYRAGRQLIDLVVVGTTLGGEEPVTPRGNMDHLCLTIDPFDAVSLTAYLQQHQIEPSTVGVRYGATGYGESLYIKDPDGHTIELKGPDDGESTG